MASTFIYPKEYHETLLDAVNRAQQQQKIVEKYRLNGGIEKLKANLLYKQNISELIARSEAGEFLGDELDKVELDQMARDRMLRSIKADVYYMKIMVEEIYISKYHSNKRRIFIARLIEITIIFFAIFWGQEIYNSILMGLQHVFVKK